MHISPVTLEAQILQRNSFGESKLFKSGIVGLVPLWLLRHSLGCFCTQPSCRVSPLLSVLGSLISPLEGREQLILSFLFEQSSSTLPCWDLLSVYTTPAETALLYLVLEPNSWPTLYSLIKWVHKVASKTNEGVQQIALTWLTIFKSLFVSVFIHKKNLKLEVSGLC